MVTQKEQTGLTTPMNTGAGRCWMRLIFALCVVLFVYLREEVVRLFRTRILQNENYLTKLLKKELYRCSEWNIK
jgi:hypothetical protein